MTAPSFFDIEAARERLENEPRAVRFPQKMNEIASRELRVHGALSKRREDLTPEDRSTLYWYFELYRPEDWGRVLFGSTAGQEFDLHYVFWHINQKPSFIDYLKEKERFGYSRKYYYDMISRDNPNDAHWFKGFEEQEKRGYRDPFESRMLKLKKENPHLIEFSDKWMDVFQVSFVCNGHRCVEGNEGVEFFQPISPYMTSNMGLYVFNDLNDERAFVESVVDVKHIGKTRRPTDDENLAFNGCQRFLDTYELTLEDGRKAVAYLDRDFSSSNQEGWLIIKSVEGLEPVDMVHEYQVPVNGIPRAPHYKSVSV